MASVRLGISVFTLALCACSQSHIAVGEPEAGRPQVDDESCLAEVGTSTVPAADRTYTLRSGRWSSSEQPLSTAEGILVQTPRDWGGCIAMFREDGTVAWSFSIHFDESVRWRIGWLQGALHLVALAPGEVRWMPLDPATGQLGALASAPTGSTMRPQVFRFAGRAGGDFLVVWGRDGRLEARAFGADGVPLGPLVPLADDGRDPHLLGTEDGYRVAFHHWRDGEVEGPAIARLAFDGTLPTGSETFTYPAGAGRAGEGLRFHTQGERVLATWVVTEGADRVIEHAQLDGSWLPAAEPIPLLAAPEQRLTSTAMGPSGLLLGIDTARTEDRSGFAVLPPGSREAETHWIEGARNLRVAWASDGMPLVFWSSSASVLHLRFRDG